MKDGKIKESQLSSSSYMKTELNKTGNCPHFSRPGSVGVFTVEDGMLQYDRNNFLQVDFRTKTKVEMVMKSKVTFGTVNLCTKSKKKTIFRTCFPKAILTFMIINFYNVRNSRCHFLKSSYNPPKCSEREVFANFSCKVQ